MSLVAGNGIEINTGISPGTSGTVIVKFAGTGADDSTLVMPANLQLLEDLSDHYLNIL